MKIIQTSSGHAIQVDDEDFDFLSTFNWILDRSKNGSLYPVYAQKKPNGSKHLVRIHRLLMSPLKNEVVDHIDGDALNNQKTNLRVCGPMQNSWNAKLNKKKASGLPKGVVWNRACQKYLAQIYVDGRKYYYGVHPTPQEAAHAYNKAAIEHFGEFARLNPL